MINHVENDLIEIIDRDLSHIDYDAEAERYNGFRTHVIRIVNRMLQSASAFPETDNQLLVRLQQGDVELKKQTQKLRNYCIECGMTVNKLRHLKNNKDPARVEFCKLMQGIDALKQERTEIIECLDSRNFLRCKVKWVQTYLLIRTGNQPQMGQVQAGLMTMYPEN